jgi:hypothetical protein
MPVQTTRHLPAVSFGEHMKYNYHKDGTLPHVGDGIFVFGSNLAGVHGAGAARVAAELFDAKDGEGEGETGGAYAIPTKGFSVEPLSLAAIAYHIARFIDYAVIRPGNTFFVTRVGCGLAGFTDAQIAPLFKDAPLNCNFAEEWREFLE